MFDWNPFWESAAAGGIKHPAPLRSLLHQIDPAEAAAYELLFRARFLTNLHEIMRREGKDAQGFDRMQQTFSESVIFIRERLIAFGESTGWDSQRYEKMDSLGLSLLLDLASDLSAVKSWLIEQESSNTPSAHSKKF